VGGFAVRLSPVNSELPGIVTAGQGARKARKGKARYARATLIGTCNDSQPKPKGYSIFVPEVFFVRIIEGE
jgi:hypothetical protein